MTFSPAVGIALVILGMVLIAFLIGVGCGKALKLFDHTPKPPGIK